MTKWQSLTVTLYRPCLRMPWGISIAGGSDLDTPLIVTRSENEELEKGDVIKKIDEYDARDLRHVDAQNLFRNSQCVKLAIQRPRRAQATPPLLPKSPIPPPTPVEVPERTCRTFTPDHFDPAHDHRDEVREERFYLSQPYRTTPLVLPGAKIKKDAPLGECYLRHHPNPMVRAAPHSNEINAELAMKQRVADSVLQRCLSPNDHAKVVSKQFNTPIGLYSEQNIADTMRGQASAIPKKPAKWDPNLSEAYKALQEESFNDGHVHQFSQPSRQGYFAPSQKSRQSRVSSVQFRSKSPAINVVDCDTESIQQSNSFKRVMYSVMGETQY